MDIQSKKFPKDRENDWFDELTGEQQQDILEGIVEAERGEVVPH